jgi:hypothetical protein
MLRQLQLLLARLGVNRITKELSSTRFLMPSIQPKHNASSTVSSHETLGIPVDFFQYPTHNSSEQACSFSSQARNASGVAKWMTSRGSIFLGFIFYAYPSTGDVISPTRPSCVWCSARGVTCLIKTCQAYYPNQEPYSKPHSWRPRGGTTGEKINNTGAYKNSGSPDSDPCNKRTVLFHLIHSTKLACPRSTYVERADKRQGMAANSAG